MAIKIQKVTPIEVFHHTEKMKFNEKRADMFDIAIYSLNADTATREHKNFTFDFVAVPCRAKRLRFYFENWRSHERLSDI